MGNKIRQLVSGGALYKVHRVLFAGQGAGPTPDAVSGIVIKLVVGFKPSMAGACLCAGKAVHAAVSIGGAGKNLHAGAALIAGGNGLKQHLVAGEHNPLSLCASKALVNRLAVRQIQKSSHAIALPVSIHMLEGVGVL